MRPVDIGVAVAAQLARGAGDLAVDLVGRGEDEDRFRAVRRTASSMLNVPSALIGEIGARSTTDVVTATCAARWSTASKRLAFSSWSMARLVAHVDLLEIEGRAVAQPLAGSCRCRRGTDCRGP